ncbi:MAG: cobalamin-binding protein [Spirulina sp. SIO3F2]|nr:cobalamin-binding protein [Spirulina sp. SIO3F2]
MKIVTLLPSATEIVAALVPLSQLVAVSHECDFPPGVETLPRITSSIIPAGLSAAAIDSAVSQAVQDGKAIYQVNGDLLAELKPDLIVTQGLCDVCAVNVDTVKETLVFLPDALPEGAEILSLTSQNIAGVFRDIERVGVAVNQADAARHLVAQLRDRWAKLAQSLPTQKPKVLMLEWPEPPFFGGHWVPEMVAVAGGVDVLGQPGQDSGRCTWAEIAERDPDVIVAIACGQNLAQNLALTEQLRDRPEFRALRAVQNQQVWVVDANSYFSRPGPRLVAGAELLRQILHHPQGTIAGAQQLL